MFKRFKKLGKFFECEADRKIKYYRVIQTEREYEDGRRFPINEEIICDKKVNLKAKEPKDMGGFCISTYDYVFRWLIRGDTLCEVVIPDDSIIYKTSSVNGIYVSEKIILTNPQKIDDDFATKLYKASNLPEESYFKAMTACAICGYINTALLVCNEKVNTENVEIAIQELENFCNRRKEENFINDYSANENLNKLRVKLAEIKIK